MGVSGEGKRGVGIKVGIRVEDDEVRGTSGEKLRIPYC